MAIVAFAVTAVAETEVPIEYRHLLSRARSGAMTVLGKDYDFKPDDVAFDQVDHLVASLRTTRPNPTPAPAILEAYSSTLDIVFEANNVLEPGLARSDYEIDASNPQRPLLGQAALRSS